MSEPDLTLPKTAGRPSKAELDERAAALDEREAELNAMAASIGPGARQPIDEVHPRKDGDNPNAIRKGMGNSRRLDDEFYLKFHQDKQLMWINDLQGDVQRWIDWGAEPVPVRSRSDRVFEGITDKAESQWVRSIGGDDGMGNHFWVYLLMIDPEVYEEIKIGPERDRQDAIRRAMKIGGDQSADAQGGALGGPKLPTYSPNLPTGERGFDEKRESVKAES